MHAENLIINQGCDWQAIETVRESLPQFYVVPPLAFVIKSVDPINRGAFMVPSQQEKVFRVLNLVRQQETYGLETLSTPVDIVTEEQIVAFRRVASILEQPQ